MHRFLLALGTLIVIVQPTAAQVAPNSGITSSGNVTVLFVDETSFGVERNGPMPNPAHCPAPDYRSQNQLHNAAALTAFTMIESITITVDQNECADGHPKIVSIQLSRKGDDLPVRVEAIQDSLFSMSNRLDTLEQHVIDANNQTNQLITQRADQGSAQGNQIASKVDQVQQFLLAFSREVARDSSGRTLINLVGSIAQKVGAP